MKGKTIFYLIAAGLLVAGIALCAVALSVVGLDWDRLSASKPRVETTRQFSTADALSVNIIDSNKKITLEPSEDADTIEIIYYDNDESHYDINLDQTGRLNIQYTEKMHWYEYVFTFNWKDYDMTVRVPASYDGGISLKTSNANITVGDMNITGSLTAKTSNAKITAENLNVDGDYTAETSNGRIESNNLFVTGDIITDTSNAEQLMTKVSANGINCTTSNGKISLIQVVAGDWLTCKTSNGAVEFYDIDAGRSIDCKTSNGKVSGSIAGKMTDYRIVSKTSNGDNNLPDNWPGGDKLLDIKTSNARIDVSFNER